MPKLPKLTVWYNSKCPVCDAGIDRQRNRLLQAAQSGAIEFRDINFEPEALARFGAGLEEVRRRLYALDAEGKLHVGADCAVAVWLRRRAMNGAGASSASPASSSLLASAM